MIDDKMTMSDTATYRDQVYHLTLWFAKPGKSDYIGSWSTEWAEMMEMLNDWIQGFTQGSIGILSVNIVKTEPSSGYIFAVYITYWLHP